MKTMLIFRRQTMVDDLPHTEVKAVEVELPESIKKGDGWVLWGQADEVEVCIPVSTVGKINSDIEPKKKFIFGSKINADIDGSAKLVRRNSEIKIVYRRGKSESTPNSVCISDLYKNTFFGDCRSLGKANYSISSFSESSAYEKWSKIMENEYLRQLNVANK